MLFEAPCSQYLSHPPPPPLIPSCDCALISMASYPIALSPSPRLCEAQPLLRQTQGGGGVGGLDTFGRLAHELQQATKEDVRDRIKQLKLTRDLLLSRSYGSPEKGGKGGEEAAAAVRDVELLSTKIAREESVLRSMEGFFVSPADLLSFSERSQDKWPHLFLLLHPPPFSILLLPPFHLSPPPPPDESPSLSPPLLSPSLLSREHDLPNDWSPPHLCSYGHSGYTRLPSRVPQVIRAVHLGGTPRGGTIVVAGPGGRVEADTVGGGEERAGVHASVASGMGEQGGGGALQGSAGREALPVRGGGEAGVSWGGGQAESKFTVVVGAGDTGDV